MSGNKYVAPNLGLAAFNCPHCGALAQQQWWAVLADPKEPDRAHLLSGEDFDSILAELSGDDRVDMERFKSAATSFNPTIFKDKQNSYTPHWVPNSFFSSCFACDESSFWIAGRLIWPLQKNEIAPNEDLPGDVCKLFEEAREILDASPRGAAALMRLAIEKLCRSLNKTGSIDSMIAQMVTDGLNERVKNALDIVRVTGNTAVHPGTIESGDNRQAVITMFQMTNIIADRLITQEKTIDNAYLSIDEDKRKWIDDRDKGALKKRGDPA